VVVSPGRLQSGYLIPPGLRFLRHVSQMMSNLAGRARLESPCCPCTSEILDRPRDITIVNLPVQSFSSGSTNSFGTSHICWYQPTIKQCVGDDETTSTARQRVSRRISWRQPQVLSVFIADSAATATPRRGRLSTAVFLLPLVTLEKLLRAEVTLAFSS
jgi:hypothetical protein